jgi:HEAT repeat protein
MADCGGGSIEDFVRSRLAEFGLHSLLGGRIPWKKKLDNASWLLILDGLDEMRLGPAHESLSRIFDELGALLGGRCRCVITARSHLFLRSHHVRGINEYGQWSKHVNGRPPRSVYLVCELGEFNKSQKLRYLRVRFGRRVKRIVDAIGGVYGLRSLVGRPLFMKMIADEVGAPGWTAPASIDIGELFRTYVSRTLRARAEITRTSPEEIAAVSREVARRLLRGRVGWLDAESMRDVIEHAIGSKLQRISGHGALLNLPGDLLLSGEDERFRFSHESLFEYFVADAIWEDLSRRAVGLLNCSSLSRETLVFLSSIMKEAAGCWAIQWLMRKLGAMGRQRTLAAINALRLTELLAPELLRTLVPQALASHNSAVVKAALKVAGYHHLLQLTPHLKKLVQSRESEIKYLALEVVGLYRIPDLAEAIAKGVYSRDKAIRRISIWALRKVRSADLVDTALDLVASPDPSAVFAAATCLGMRQEARAADVLASLADSATDPWTSYYIREALAAIQARSKLNWAADVNGVLHQPTKCLALLKRRAGWWRRYTIEAIGEGRLDQYAMPLQKMYCSATPYERNTIIDALGEMRSARNTAFFRSTFAAERDAKVRGNIVWAVGNAGDVNGLDVILSGLNDKDASVRTWAEWARAQFASVDALSGAGFRYTYPQ